MGGDPQNGSRRKAEEREVLVEHRMEAPLAHSRPGRARTGRRAVRLLGAGTAQSARLEGKRPAAEPKRAGVRTCASLQASRQRQASQ